MCFTNKLFPKYYPTTYNSPSCIKNKTMRPSLLSKAVALGPVPPSGRNGGTRAVEKVEQTPWEALRKDCSLCVL